MCGQRTFHWFLSVSLMAFQRLPSLNIENTRFGRTSVCQAVADRWLILFGLYFQSFSVTFSRVKWPCLAVVGENRCNVLIEISCMFVLTGISLFLSINEGIRRAFGVIFGHNLL